MPRYHVISCHVLWREFCQYASRSKNVFTFHFLKQGLHNEPDKLRSEVQAAVDAVEDRDDSGGGMSLYSSKQGNEKPDAILLGYGLCSNGTMDIIARTVPIVIPRAHDCITFLLGSKERYREYFDAHPGTYWYSPGWIDTGFQPGEERFGKMRESLIEKYGEDNGAYLYEMEMSWVKKYTHAAYVDLGTGESESYVQYTKDCSEYCGWKFEKLPGDPGLFERFVAGDWNEEDFLTVNPGESIQPSHDDSVIRTQTPQNIAKSE